MALLEFRKRSLAPSVSSKSSSKSLPHFTNSKVKQRDANKYGKGGGHPSAPRKLDKRTSRFLGIIITIYALKRMIFPLSRESMNFFDNGVRQLWTLAETSGLIEHFPVYKTDYDEDFPHLSLLEEHYETIREEALELLSANRNHIPRLKDLVETKRSASKVYKTDWKTFWFKMGAFIPENCARAPKTAELLHQIPDVYNAFFSVLEPRQHIDPHWGHYKGFLRYHLGLIVPQNNTKKDCFLRIRNDIEKNTTLWLYEREALLAEGTHYYWHEGEGVMFDDNPLHDATNDSDEERVVLFLDLARKLPWYLDVFNRIAIFAANHQKQITTMRKRAVLDEATELIPIG